MKFDIEAPFQSFEEHITEPYNSRILFSGKFGIGKTYFLDAYFKDNEAFEAIHLYPVNYSTASNEDIFELIKHDILFELLKKNVQFDKLNIPHIETALAFAKENAHHILAPFLNLLPVVGKSVYTIYDKLQQLSEKYLNEHDQKQIDDRLKTDEYLEAFYTKKGCIYEDDFFSQLIRQLVQQLKGDDKSHKKIVLIIDDLDRIDPEHIFRILNVLAAHTDLHTENQNKFGFDKMILVCDIENIESIYAHKYGSKTDFDGYIDKFYSSEVFFLENNDAIILRLKELLNSISENIFSKREKNIYQKRGLINHDLTYILTSMVNAKIITIRTLQKLLLKKTILNRLDPKFSSKNFHSSYILEGIYIIYFLVWITGSLEKLIEGLHKCHDFTSNSFGLPAKSYFIENLIPLLSYKEHQFDNSPDNRYRYSNSNIGSAISFKLTLDHDYKTDEDITRINLLKSTINLEKVNYMKSLLDTAILVKENNILHTQQWENKT